MKLPWTRSVGNVGGGLRFLERSPFPRILCVPRVWDVPDHLDNSGYCTPLESQGQNPWCAAYSMCQLLQASYWRAHNSKLDFNEAGCYAEAKRIDGLSGGGTSLEAVLQAARNVPLCSNGIRPTITADEIQDPESIPFAIHQHGLVLVGLRVTDGWTSTAWDGDIGKGIKPIGGHAVLCSGYSLTDGKVWGPNWWGRSWGHDGFWRMTRAQFAQQFVYGYAATITWTA